MKRIAINGFGRIGRMVARAFAEQNVTDMQIVAINDLSPIETSAHLFEFDSVHKRYPKDVTHGENWIDFGMGKIDYFSEKSPEQLPWSSLNIDVILECSGFFTSKYEAAKHIKAGAKKVLISAPANDTDLTVVFGVNHAAISEDMHIISNASCTTNCLAPVASVLHSEFGIEQGYMTTVHAYTGDQRIIDTGHSDLRRARAGALSMIPTSTGAAKAVSLVLPELKGRLDGTAIRVPTPNVSMIDFTFVTRKGLSVESINNAMKQASNTHLKGILGYNTNPLVSIDFNHNPHSSIFDATQTQVVGENFGRILSWYDNEWGFANRMIDVSRIMASFV